MFLLQQKEEVTKKSSQEGGLSDEELESIQVQIQFKENRIRQLASSLRKPILASRGGDIQKIDLLLGSKALDKINSGMYKVENVRSSKTKLKLKIYPKNKGISTTNSTQAMLKVLLGMIVKERRRVTSLARTASKLDEQVVNLEHERNKTDAALRSRISEQSHERAAMANEQQELILSLMSLVKDDSSRSSKTNKDDVSQPALAITFAQQRVSALEMEVKSLREECSVYEGVNIKNEKLMGDLELEKTESNRLRDELFHMRNIIKKIKEKVPLEEGNLTSTTASNEPTSNDVHELIDKALHCPSSESVSSTTFNSDIEDEYCENSDFPEWADDIMTDLQIIAEGGVPDCLKNHDAESVFARLSNPHNFTGTQKHTRKLETMSELEASTEYGHKGVKSSNIVLNPEVNDQMAGKSASGQRGYKKRNVFQRLISPSSYTSSRKTALEQNNHLRLDGSMISLRNEMSSENDVGGQNITQKPLSENSQENISGDGKSQPKLTTKKNSSYVGQNVFERLSHNITLSFAGKVDHDDDHKSPRYQGTNFESSV